MSKPYRRRVNNFLLDRSYQLRHAFALVLVCVFILSVMGFYWLKEMEVASQVMEVDVISTMRQGDAIRLKEQLDSQWRERLAVVVGGSVLLCLVVGAFVVVLTHSVAGPVHVVRRRMDRIAEGHLDGDLRPLRKGDSLAEFYATFRAMVERLQLDARGELEALDRAIARVEALPPDAAGDAADLLAELRELKGRKIKQLGEAA